MSLAEFKSAPWGKPHRLYRESALSVSPAPEYANSEVLVAGLYRTIGLEGFSERVVPGNGRELDRTIGQFRDRGRRPDGAALEGDAAHSLLHDVLESPKLPNQSSKRFLQVSPLVGETAVFSGSARLAGSPWSGGSLVRRMIWLGSQGEEAATVSWKGLFDALAVDDGDDVFARFLRDELSAWTGTAWGPECVMPAEQEVRQLPAGELDGLASPARQFALDLAAVISAKPLMTRRQWTSLLEALIRVASVAHVAWLCEVQQRVWDCLREALAAEAAPSDIRSRIYPQKLSYLSYGTVAVSELKDRTSKYLRARLGINTLLWSLEDAGVSFGSELSSAASVSALCQQVSLNRGKLSNVLGDVDDLADREARAMLCRKGIGSNVMEFARHVLQQRQAADPILRSYDQGYVLRKRSAANRARTCVPLAHWPSLCSCIVRSMGWLARDLCTV